MPHVLQGSRLCIYLDPSREWDPAGGVTAFLERLWSWLSDASTNSFDPSTALYHAVGGVLHSNQLSPTFVVRSELPNKPALLYATSRSEHRIDIDVTRGSDSLSVAMWTSDHALPLGAGSSLAELGLVLSDPNLESSLPASVADLTRGIGDALVATAKRNPDGSPAYAVLTIAHPAGGSPHVLVGRVSAASADQLRALRRFDDVPNVNIEWCPVSDERPSVTNRRDTRSAASFLRGKTLTILGCGGLGSWIAEFAVRAGVSRIRLVDPGSVAGGLLVRQNFTEMDIGQRKVAALAERLRHVSDDIEVITRNELVYDLATAFEQDDLVVDASVSRAVTRLLNEICELGPRRPLVAQVATDSNTGTLGLVGVLAPSDTRTLDTVDTHARSVVESSAFLESFETFWAASSASQIVPTRGCSVPTFHGSAADMAAVSGSVVSLLGLQVAHPQSGVHLISLPHAPKSAPRHHFIEAARSTVSGADDSP